MLLAKANRLAGPPVAIMDLYALSPEDRLSVAAACAKEGVDESYASFVAEHLDATDDSWRWCCGSSCDPCVQALSRAVDRARIALGILPPAQPDEERPS